MSSHGHITLRGVEVHNLQGIDLDIPRQKIVVFCGLSGSGKSSLALDTLYAEGQRRYIESFSAYTRQFLQRLEKPDAEHIDGIPPAIAVTGKNGNRSSRSTVGTVTETADYLRLLFAKIGHVFCRQCGREVHRDSPQSVVQRMERFASGRRFMITFPARRRARRGTRGPDGVAARARIRSSRCWRTDRPFGRGWRTAARHSGHRSGGGSLEGWDRHDPGSGVRRNRLFSGPRSLFRSDRCRRRGRLRFGGSNRNDRRTPLATIGVQFPVRL